MTTSDHPAPVTPTVVQGDIEGKSDKVLVQVHDLTVHYPIGHALFSASKASVKAVDGLTFDVYEGETLGVVGESGCGKSTAGRAIIGLEELTDGMVSFNGYNLANLTVSERREMRQQMQMVFQDPYSSLDPQQRVGEILAEPLLAHRLATRKEAREKALKMLSTVGLEEEFAYRYPHELSGGQRQRVGVARALMLEPRLIICDEPVSALDVSIQAQVLNLLQELQGSLHLTYIFISHGLGAVKYISDRILVMYLGKIMEIGTREEIFEHPRHPYTEILLNAYPPPNPHDRDDRKRVVAQGEVPSAAAPPSGCVFHTRCPFAQPICSQEVPVLRGGEHAFACHFPLGKPAAATADPAKPVWKATVKR